MISAAAIARSGTPVCSNLSSVSTRVTTRGLANTPAVGPYPSPPGLRRRWQSWNSGIVVIVPGTVRLETSLQAVSDLPGIQTPPPCCGQTDRSARLVWVGFEPGTTSRLEQPVRIVMLAARAIEAARPPPLPVAICAIVRSFRGGLPGEAGHLLDHGLQERIGSRPQDRDRSGPPCRGPGVPKAGGELGAKDHRANQAGRAANPGQALRRDSGARGPRGVAPRGRPPGG